MLVRNPQAAPLLRDSGPRPIAGWLAWIGAWCKQVLDRALPEEQAAIARALLLGDGSAMTGSDWDKYLNTGVIHVLAISGQHLVVLGSFAWLMLRLGGVSRRRGALVVACFLMAYALLVGAWLAVTRVVAQRFHLVSPVALVIGPPMVLLPSIALLSGFVLLLLAPLLWPLALVFARITQWSLAGCEALVDSGARWPGAYWYVPDVPGWWLWLFYSGLLGFLTVGTLRRRLGLFFLTVLGWMMLGLGASLLTWRTGEFRCTFVAVGQRDCIELGCASSRIYLYDAGAITGPDVTRRQIAPFLLSRGIRRIDEPFLSHADLDPFHG